MQDIDPRSPPPYRKIIEMQITQYRPVQSRNPAADHVFLMASQAGMPKILLPLLLTGLHTCRLTVIYPGQIANHRRLDLPDAWDRSPPLLSQPTGPKPWFIRTGGQKSGAGIHVREA